MNRKIRIWSLCTVALLLGGCATGAKRENMLYAPPAEQQASYDEALRENTSVETVQGGSETNPAWTSEISNAEFEGALKISLKNVGLLKQGGRYKLDVRLEKVEQPLFGFNFTVTTHVLYRLTDAESDAVVYEKRLVTPYTATVGDAFMGITRLRLANEGAAKENIKALLSDLAELDVYAGGVEVLGDKARSGSKRSVQERLEELERIRTKGLISPEEYLRKRRAILNEI